MQKGRYVLNLDINITQEHLPTKGNTVEDELNNQVNTEQNVDNKENEQIFNFENIDSVNDGIKIEKEMETSTVVDTAENAELETTNVDEVASARREFKTTLKALHTRQDEVKSQYKALQNQTFSDVESEINRFKSTCNRLISDLKTEFITQDPYHDFYEQFGRGPNEDEIQDLKYKPSDLITEFEIQKDGISFTAKYLNRQLIEINNGIFTQYRDAGNTGDRVTGSFSINYLYDDKKNQKDHQYYYSSVTEKYNIDEERYYIDSRLKITTTNWKNATQKNILKSRVKENGEKETTECFKQTRIYNDGGIREHDIFIITTERPENARHDTNVVGYNLRKDKLSDNGKVKLNNSRIYNLTTYNKNQIIVRGINYNNGIESDCTCYFNDHLFRKLIKDTEISNDGKFNGRTQHTAYEYRYNNDADGHCNYYKKYTETFDGTADVYIDNEITQDKYDTWKECLHNFSYDWGEVIEYLNTLYR